MNGGATDVEHIRVEEVDEGKKFVEGRRGKV